MENVRLIRNGMAFGYPVSALRTEARKGRLALLRVAGKDYVSYSAIREMEAKCKIQREPDYALRNGTMEAPQPTSLSTGQSSLARVAAETALKMLRKPSRTTFKTVTGQTPGKVISLRSDVRT